MSTIEQQVIVKGARGESEADILRRTGVFGVLPTDDDATAEQKKNAVAIAAKDAAELARDQAADLVLAENVFVRVDLATAQADGEAAVAEGTFFKAVGQIEGESQIRLRTALGSDLIYTEITKSRLNSAAGASEIGLLQGGTLADAVRYVTPQMFDAVGDGVTDDAAAFQAAQAAVTAAGGGVIVVPWTANGYRIGDGTNAAQSTYSSGISVTSRTIWRGEAGVKLICGAFVEKEGEDEGNFLFFVDDCDDVEISGFTFEGQAIAQTSQPYVAVALRGVVRRIYVHDCQAYNFANFAGQYADERTNAAVAYFEDVEFRRFHVGGWVGVEGGGSGFNFFPRTVEGDAPRSRRLTIADCNIDVTNGSDSIADHGPQCIKVNNTDIITLLNNRTIGGKVVNVTLTNGCRNAVVDGSGSKSNLGLDIGTDRNTVATRTQRISVARWHYRLDGATGGNAVGLRIKGGLRSVTVQDAQLLDASLWLMGNYDNDILLSDGLGSAMQGVSLVSLVIDNGIIEMRDSATALQENLAGLHFGFIDIRGKAGNNTGMVDLFPANWALVDSVIETLRSTETDNDVLRLGGAHNVVQAVICVDGNPDADANGWVVDDSGDGNRYGSIYVGGAANNMNNIFNKNGGSGASVGRFLGAVSDAQYTRVVNQENANPILGPIRAVTREIDLDGGPSDEVIFTADQKAVILSVTFAYTEASSADGGVLVRLAANDSTRINYVSEPSKSLGDKTVYQNSDGTRNIPTRVVNAGDVLRVTCPGDKVGAGKVTVTVNLVAVED